MLVLSSSGVFWTLTSPSSVFPHLQSGPGKAEITLNGCCKNQIKKVYETVTTVLDKQGLSKRYPAM